MALIGDGVCAVKTLTRNHLYCEPPAQQPTVSATKKREATNPLLEFTVSQRNLHFFAFEALEYAVNYRMMTIITLLKCNKKHIGI